MAMNNQTVAHHFANSVGRSASGSNFFFDADKLWSYGRHFCVARRLSPNVFVMTLAKYGQATSKHLAYARNAFNNRTVVFAHDPDDSAAANKRAAEADIMTELDNAATVRRILQKTRDAHRAHALHIMERFNAYLAALPEVERENVTPFDLTTDAAQALRDARDARRAEDEARHEAARQQTAMAQVDRLEKWKAGENVNGSMHALPVALRLHSHMSYLGTKVDERRVIQTSHGAEIPVTDAIALWPLIQAVRAGRLEQGQALSMVRRLGVYNMTSFANDGSIRVGCHFIEYAELARMAVLLNLSTDGGDNVPSTMRPAIGFKRVHISGVSVPVKYAKWDGQPARPPRKGELYLSGAVVTAYRAKDDMTTPYFIATECQE